MEHDDLKCPTCGEPLHRNADVAALGCWNVDCSDLRDFDDQGKPIPRAGMCPDCGHTLEPYRDTRFLWCPKQKPGEAILFYHDGKPLKPQPAPPAPAPEPPPPQEKGTPLIEHLKERKQSLARFRTQQKERADALTRDLAECGKAMAAIDAEIAEIDHALAILPQGTKNTEPG